MVTETNSSRDVTTGELSDLNFYMGDRLARFILVRGWSPLQVALSIYGLALLSSFLIAWTAGTLFPNQTALALLEDEFYFLSETIMVPVIWGYYLWICQAPANVLTELAEADVLEPRAEDVNRAKEILENHWVIGAVILIAGLASLIYYLQYADFFPLLWYNTRLEFLLLRSILVIFPTAFAGCSLLARGIINVLVFKRVLRGVNVNPLHPDRAGGLLPLGQYALRTTYLIALAGIVAALAEYSAIQKGTFSTATFFHLAILVYVIAAPVTFFAPLGTARNAMRVAKDSLMLRISKQFNKDFPLALQGLEESADELKENLAKLEQLQKLQELTESFPVWPFDIETIRRFALAITSPIFAIGISILSDFLTDLVLGGS